jgi:UPF0755 protein
VTPPKKPRWIPTSKQLALAGALVAALGLYLALVLGYGTSHGPGSGREVDLDWPTGLSVDEAAERLEAAGLVSNPRLFALYLRATGAGSDLRAGRHLLADDMSPRAIVRRMQRTLVHERVKVAVPEGFTRFDIARRLQGAKVCAAKAFIEATGDPALLLALGIDGESAEGYLFPATYEFALDAEPSQVVTRMKAEFDKRFDRLARDNAMGTEALRARMGWNKAEIVTLASIIEKEAAHDDERPVIASVFLNRLKDPAFTPKRLQSDPTSAYGCLSMPERITSCHAFAGRVTPEMNADDSNPYTTYRHEGLPPGPIANPGEKSIQAVLVPAESRYLYFVARGEGRHTFSETYAQHNEAIRRQHAPPP